MLFDRSRSRSWSPGRQESPSRDRKAVKIEEPSMELLRMKEVIPDEPMSPDEDPGIFFFHLDLVKSVKSITFYNTGFLEALEIMENLENHYKNVPCMEKSLNLKKPE